MILRKIQWRKNELPMFRPTFWFAAKLKAYPLWWSLQPWNASTNQQAQHQISLIILIIVFLVLADTRGPCSRRSCRADSLCVESGDMAFCECQPSECGLHLNPVCGSDGATYKNHCLLRKAACIKEEPIAVLDRGPCSKSLEPLFVTYPKKPIR